VAIDPRLSPIAALQHIADSLERIDDANERNRAYIELQRQILVANREWSGLLDEIREMKDRIKAFDTWDTESKRYRLIRLNPGFFVRELIPEAANGEPAHFLCEDCFNKRERGMMHSETSMYAEHLKCGRCKAEHTLSSGRRPNAGIADGTDYDPFEKYR